MPGDDAPGVVAARQWAAVTERSAILYGVLAAHLIAVGLALLLPPDWLPLPVAISGAGFILLVWLRVRHRARG